MVQDQANAITFSSPVIRLYSKLITTPLYRNKLFLTQKYQVDGLSARQIANLIGCAHSVINGALDRYLIVKKYRKPGKPPYGYKFQKNLTVKHPQQQKVIAQIKKYKFQGLSNQEIVNRLNDKGIKSPARKGRWHPATVSRILKR